jgi:predicted signal transduction protein with EAL and GGDEF domain
MKYEVIVTNRDDGKQFSVLVEADDDADAIAQAQRAIITGKRNDYELEANIR